MIGKEHKPYSKYVRDAIKCIGQQIDDNPFKHKTASELLEKFAKPHRSSVEKAFKNVYGKSIKGYQVRQRLEASKRFLEEEMTKKQVAAKCFYSDASTFAAAFKKQFGLTPTEWQSIYT
jgi:AraC-like DNA-binding protein